MKEVIVVNLTIMTPEWKKLADDITIYILQQRIINDLAVQSKLKDKYSLFNAFVQNTGTNVAEPDLALWCVNYIKDITTMPLNKLKLAAQIDELSY